MFFAFTSPDFGVKLFLMKTLYLFLLTFLISTSAFAATLSSTDQTYVDQAQSWIKNLDTATAKFQQIDYQGNVMRGTFYINRPGRLRFEYDAPTKDFIVADGYLIHFYDGETGQSNSAPIGSTLADFILRENGGFNDKVNVKNVSTTDDMINIAVENAEQPGTGELILNYSKTPFSLKSWRIIDAQGLTTDIILSGLDREKKIPASLFTIDNRNLNN